MLDLLQELAASSVWLYIKTHNITGLKYFGKHYGDDPCKYKGSGVYWNRHLIRHGNDVHTELIGPFYSKEDIQLYAIMFSLTNDIVNSSKWANLIIEDGISTGNLTGYRHSVETKEKISRIGKGRTPWNKGMIGILKDSIETKKKKSSALLNNTRSKGRIQSINEKKLRSAAMLGINKGKILPTRGIPKKTIKCPHCAFIGAIPNMKRWHFDNCKELKV